MKLYRYLTGPDDASFSKHVSKQLNKGWVLYGSPSLTTTKGGRTIAGQAVVKDVYGDYSDDIDLTEA